MAVNLGEPYYVEHVTSDVEATRALLEATHGWTFGEPDPVLGGSIVAKLPGGGRCGVRAPLRVDENPVTRVYIRVESVARTVSSAGKQGAQVAIDSMDLGEHGTIAIFILGGVEHSIWQLPEGRS